MGQGNSEKKKCGKEETKPSRGDEMATPAGLNVCLREAASMKAGTLECRHAR